MSEEVGPKRSDARGRAGDDVAAGTAGSPVRRKRRRWLRRVVILVLLLLVVVFCLPYLLSTGAGTKLAVGIANACIPGRLSLQEVSLRWLGPCTVKGGSLTDPQGKEVVRVDNIVYGGGVLTAITSPTGFKELRLEAPRVFLYVDRDGRVSLVDALVSQRAAPQQKKPSALPPVTGRVLLQNGSARIVRPDGRQIEISQINVSCTLDTLNNIEGTLSMRVPSDGEIGGEAKIRNLAPGGQFKPFDAAGTLRLSTPNGVSVAELAAFLTDEAQVAGKVALAIDGVIENGGIRVEMKTTASGLQARHKKSGRIEPIDGQVVATIQATKESLTGRASLKTQAGNGQFDLAYPLTGQPPEGASVDLVSAILSGRTEAIPALSIDGQCRLDLARLAKAVPAFLAIRPDVEVISGTLDMERLAIRGSGKPSLVGSVVLKDLVARSGGKTIQWEPASLGLDVLVEQGRGLKVQQGELKTGFGKLTAGGTASEVHAEIQADLAELHRQAAQVFDLGSTEMAGKLTGGADLKRAGESRINMASSLTAEALRYRAGERRVECGKLLLTGTGHLDIAGTGFKEIVAEARADVDGKIIATGTSRSSMADKTYQAEANVTQADLGYIGDVLKRLAVVDASSTYAGNATFQMKARRAAADAPIVSDGSLVLRNASVGGKPVSTDDVTLRWSEAGVAEGGRVKVKLAELASSVARVSANAVDCRFAGELAAAANVQGDADLGKLLEVTSRIAGKEKAPAIAGRAAFKIDCSSAADAVRLVGNWTVDGLEIGTGDRRMREKQMKLTFDSALRQKQDTLDVTQVALDSRLLTLKLAGKVSEFSGSRRLAIAGEYSGSWDAITALIHELAPATAETVAITGTTGGRIEISGSACQPKVRPVFADVTTGLGITWDSATAYGLHLGKGTLSAGLKQGQLQIPLAVIPATSGGKIRLGGLVDFRPEEPTLSIRDRVALMENIPVTPELGKYLLSRVNPIFGNMTRAEGATSLTVQGVEVPLGEALKHRGTGQGRLDLRDLKIAPGGLLGEAMALGGLGNQELYTVKVEGIDFALKEGRLRYDNFALIFAKDFDLRFRGSVGFDDTLDLIMSVPVRPALLERCGVSGPVADYARLLADARVEVPIVGTRLHPKMDLAKVDTKPLIQRALRDIATGKAGGLLNNLGGLGQPAQPQSPQPQPGATRTPAQPQSPQRQPGVIRKPAQPQSPQRQPGATRKPTQPAEKSVLDLLKGAASQPSRNGTGKQR